MKHTDLATVSRLVSAFLIGFLFLYLIYSMLSYGDSYLESQTSNIEQIIDKALVQCYALEGAYPPELEYVEKYGVVLDNDKYYYDYDWQGSNLKPTIIVVEK